MVPNYFSDEQLQALEFNPEYLIRKGTCPVCAGAKSYFYRGEEHACPDDDYGHPALRLVKLYWLSFIPLQYQYLIWDEFPHQEAKEEVEAYLANFARIRLSGLGFTIYGSLGVGKTWAATHILREMAKAGYSSHFAPFMSVKSYFDLDNKEEREFLISRVCKAEVLVLDDVKLPFSEAQRNFFEDKLEDVLRNRTNMNFPTIVTSNLTDKEFEHEYPRCYSLLAAKNLDLKLEGDDARKGDLMNNQAALRLKGETKPIT